MEKTSNKQRIIGNFKKLYEHSDKNKNLNINEILKNNGNNWRNKK